MSGGDTKLYTDFADAWLIKFPDNEVPELACFQIKNENRIESMQPDGQIDQGEVKRNSNGLRHALIKESIERSRKMVSDLQNQLQREQFVLIYLESLVEKKHVPSSPHVHDGKIVHVDTCMTNTTTNNTINRNNIDETDVLDKKEKSEQSLHKDEELLNEILFDIDNMSDYSELSTGASVDIPGVEPSAHLHSLHASSNEQLNADDPSHLYAKVDKNKKQKRSDSIKRIRDTVEEIKKEEACLNHGVSKKRPPLPKPRYNSLRKQSATESPYSTVGTFDKSSDSASLSSFGSSDSSEKPVKPPSRKWSKKKLESYENWDMKPKQADGDKDEEAVQLEFKAIVNGNVTEATSAKNNKTSHDSDDTKTNVGSIVTYDNVKGNNDTLNENHLSKGALSTGNDAGKKDTSSSANAVEGDYTLIPETYTLKTDIPPDTSSGDSMVFIDYTKGDYSKGGSMKHSRSEESLNAASSAPTLPVRRLTVDSPNNVKSQKRVYEEPCQVDKNDLDSSDDEPLYYNIKELKNRLGVKKDLSSSESNLSVESLDVSPVGEQQRPSLDSISGSPKLEKSIGSHLTGDERSPASPISPQLPDSPTSVSPIDQDHMRKWTVSSILENEQAYVDCLETVLQVMKALEAAADSSQPVLNKDEINTIFFNWPTIHQMHKDFVTRLEPRVENWSAEQIVADLFKEMACKLVDVGEYMQNHPKAMARLHQCCQDNIIFAEIAKSVKCQSIPEAFSLEDLLFKPVNRLQQTLVLHDLIKCTPSKHADFMQLQKTLKITQHFLETTVPLEVSKGERYLVKDSLIVEQIGNSRKLRHVFLFNDVIICAKQRVGPKNRYNFESKWYLPLTDFRLEIPGDIQGDKDAAKKDVEVLKSKVKHLKADLRKEVRSSKVQAESGKKAFIRSGSSTRVVQRLKRKVAEQEGALVLASPSLPFKLVLNKDKKTYTFLVSSDYERDEWKEKILSNQTRVTSGINSLRPAAKFTQDNILQLLESTKQMSKITHVGLVEVKEAMDDLLNGSLTVTVNSLMGLNKAVDTFCVLEVDNYGHFYTRARTHVCCNTADPVWNQEFEMDLDGSNTLRILVYKHGSQEDILIGKSAFELSTNWLGRDFQEKTIAMNEIFLTFSIRYSSAGQTIKRSISKSKVGLYGVRLGVITRREKTKVPVIVTTCVQEIERRGLTEVGLYRVSGVTTDIQKLKRAFEKSSKNAKAYVSDMDIHAVTGVLKLYFRELPEAVFTDQYYSRFAEGYELTDHDARKKCMVSMFLSLPDANFSTIVSMLDHLVKVSQKNSVNKMTVENLAMVFGPTLLRPAAKDESIASLSLGTKDAMTQTGILLYFLQLYAEGYNFLREKAQLTQI